MQALKDVDLKGVTNDEILAVLGNHVLPGVALRSSAITDGLTLLNLSGG